MKKILQLVAVALLFGAGICFGQENAVAFDSSIANGQFLTIPAIADVQGTNARTVEFWIKAKTGQASQAQFVQWGTFEKGTKFSVRMDGGANYVLRVEHGGGYHIGTTPLNDDQWHHVAVTVPAGGLMNQSKLFVDGVEESGNDGNDVAFNTGASDIVLCRTAYDAGNSSPNPYRRYNGIIDELRIWKKDLTGEEIAAIMDSVICPDDNPDLVAYFRFNEGEGTTVADETENYDGVFGNAEAPTGEYPTWIGGKDVTTTDCNAPSLLPEYEKTALSVYPNPANNFINIKTGDRIGQVVVCDITGKQILFDETCLTRVNISSLSAGVYFVQVSIQNQGIKTFKLIKE